MQKSHSYSALENRPRITAALRQAVCVGNEIIKGSENLAFYYFVDFLSFVIGFQYMASSSHRPPERKAADRYVRLLFYQVRNRDLVRWPVQAARVRSTLHQEVDPMIAGWVEKGGSKKIASRNLNS